MKRAGHRLGTLLVAAGVVLIAYAAVTLFWRDPVTDLYTRWRQEQLSGELDRAFAEFRPIADGAAAAPGAGAAAQRRAVVRLARRFAARVQPGEPVGRIVVPRLKLASVFVNGTRWGRDLSRGPGKYERTEFPGLGKTIGIAGHRTTFGAPFRHIDDLRKGDEIVLALPYGTFRYDVFAHRIVKSDDWSVIRDRGFDTVMLSACHPLYSASHRWIVYGRLVEVKPVGGAAYAVPRRRELTAAPS